MRAQQKIMLAAVAAVIGVTAGATSAHAQTVVNLSNLDATQLGASPTTAVNSSTNLDLLNSSTALSNGGLFGGAVSILPGQQATNQVNTLGITATGGVSPVVLGNQSGVATTTPTVTINEITSAYNANVTSGTLASGTLPLQNTGSSSITLTTGETLVIGGVTYTYTGTGTTIAAGAEAWGVPLSGPSTSTGIPGSGSTTSVSGLSTASDYAGTAVWNSGSSVSIPVNASTSTTINNVNAAISSGVNNIIGANPSINAAYTGGYGGTAGGAAASGNQVGVNTLNGVGAAFASGTNVSLSQIPGAPSAPTAGALGSSIIQGGAVNSSVVNTLLAYTAAGTASVNGASLGSSGAVTGSGSQTAINTFNTATLLGDNLSVATQQKADGLNSLDTTTQSVNRALAFSSGNTLANVDPSVSNLAQTASATVNSLNIQGIASGAGTASLSGMQSVGYNTTAYNTSAPGTLPTTILTNQAVASTNTAGGVVPGTGSGSSWPGFATSVGASNMPEPSTYTNNNQLTNPNTVAGVGSVALSNLSQTTSQTNNAVSAGTTASPVNVVLGATGFTQNAGNVVMPTNANGTNGALAQTNVGSAAIGTLTQGMSQATNTFSSTGGVSGSLTQGVTGVDFASGGAVVSPQTTGSITAPNGGSGINEGPVVAGVIVPATAQNGPYVVANGVLASPVFNSATASTNYGTASLSGVAQTGSSYTNILAAGGTIDSSGAGGANSGIISQNLPSLANYGGGEVSLNNQSTGSGYTGSNSISNASQALSLYGNAITGTGGVNGSIAQSGPTTGSIGTPWNSINTGTGFGTASVATASQSNAVSLNSIASNGSLGSSSSPAGFSQSSGSSTTTAGVTSASFGTTGLGNTVGLATNAGAGASSAGSNIGQSAAFNVNSISGVGITGNATQVSNGQNSAIGNTVTSGAYVYGSSPATNVMSGNSTLSNIAQGAAQSLNTLALNGGAGNGILNQATIGQTVQTTGNAVTSFANRGFATVTGTQVASNAVNVIH